MNFEWETLHFATFKTGVINFKVNKKDNYSVARFQIFEWFKVFECTI